MKIKVNGQEVVTMKEFEFAEGERLWQAIAEQFSLVDEADEQRLAQWQDLSDTDIRSLLESAKKAEFIDDYEIEGMVDWEKLKGLEKKFGAAVVFEGVKYWLTQNAYITGPLDSPYYEASAIDASGNHYTIYWDILPEIDINDIQDESECCDWDNPSNVEAA